MQAPTDDCLRFGYWPSRQGAGEIPRPVLDPDEYRDLDVLNISCTQTGLPASRQRRIVQAWVNALPTVRASTVVFSCKVTQDLLDAACRAPDLRALFVKWSSCTSLDALSQAPALEALFIGSSPQVSDLSPLSGLSHLEHLFLANVTAPVDLSFAAGLRQLKEFGLSAARGRRMKVRSLEPLAQLQRLEMLWLVSLQVMHGGLRPLHSLQGLRSLRTTVSPRSAEYRDLCAAVPSLTYFHPVG